MEGLQFKAGGTIRPSRILTISTSANNTLVEANAADTKLMGVSMEGTQDAPQSGSSANAAESGDHMRIHMPGEVCLLQIDSSGCTAGDFLKPDNDGQGDVAGAADVVNCQALETAAGGEKALVLVISPFSIPA